MARVPFFDVGFFSGAARFTAEAEQGEEPVEEALEAEAGADEEEEDARDDADDDARDGTAAEAVVGGRCGHAGGAAGRGGRAEGDGGGGGAGRGDGLDSVTCRTDEGGGSVGYRGEVIAAGVGQGGCRSTLALVKTDLAGSAAEGAAGAFLEVESAGEGCDCGRDECGRCGYHLSCHGGEIRAVGGGSDDEVGLGEGGGVELPLAIVRGIVKCGCCCYWTGIATVGLAVDV